MFLSSYCGRWAAVGIAAAVFAASLAPAPPAAAQTTVQSVRPSTSLQQLVDEASAQFWLAYRANLPEHQLRHEQLRQAIVAWNDSSHSATDRQLMESWLREAIHRSMPGSRKALPPVPTFDRPVPSPAASRAVTSRKPIVPDPPGAGAEPAAAPTQFVEGTTKAEPVRSVLAEPAVESALSEDARVEAMEDVSPTNSDADDEFAFDDDSKTDASPPESKDDGAAFWKDHPAAKDVPGVLESGDPFGDDPQ